MRRATVPFVFAFLLAGPAAAQGQVPDTPAGHLYQAWRTAQDSGDRTTIQQFVERSMPFGRADQELAIGRQFGGFDVVAVERSTETNLVVLARQRGPAEQFVRISLNVSADGSRITGIRLQLSEPPPEFAPARMSEPEVVAALRMLLDKETAADRFAGAVLLAKDGEVLFTDAYGLADREQNVPNTLATRFRIGSMNKMFTAVSVLQLVQAGKVRLADPLGNYIPDYPNPDVAKEVTIHQLLTHTGGTGDIFGPEFEAHRLELRTLSDYVALYGNRAPAFEPGSRWVYSNYGMILAGVVIEKVSGQSYYDYVAEHVYKPAGMTLSGSEPADVPVADRSIGYMRRPGETGWVPNTDTLPYRGTSAGGGYSTVGDLLKFADALMTHKLLDAEYTKLLITGKVDVGNGARYAYGFEDRRKDGSGAVGHNGGAPGMNGELRIYPQSGYVVAVLSNLDPPAATGIAQYLDARLPTE